MDRKATCFGADIVPQAPIDSHYGLREAFREDDAVDKIDLIIGAYRDDQGRPWVLPVVKKAEKLLYEQPERNNEYLPISGLPEFIEAAQTVILGPNSSALVEGRDRWPIVHFMEQGIELMIAQSFSKNLGLYGQRVGCLHYVAPPGWSAQDTAARVASQLAHLQRSEISTPPIYGAKIASIVLSDSQLYSEWEEDLKTMSLRIDGMRVALRHELEMLKTPGDWSYITEQIGMFSLTNISEDQVVELRNKWHIYMLRDGRVSVAGLNYGNIARFAQAVDDVRPTNTSTLGSAPNITVDSLRQTASEIPTADSLNFHQQFEAESESGPGITDTAFLETIERILGLGRAENLEHANHGTINSRLQDKTRARLDLFPLQSKDYIVHLSRIANFHLEANSIFLDHVAFLQQLDQTYSQPTRTTPKSWFALLLVVVAMGKLFQGKGPLGAESPGLKEFLHGGDMFPSVLELGQDPKWAVETACLLAFYARLVGLHSLAYLYNNLIQCVKEGRLCTAIGAKFIANNELVLLAKAAGYDTIFVDLEHSNFSISEAHTLCSAGLLAGITPFVRVPSQCGSGLVQRLLDGGAMGIIFPHINTVGEAKDAVSSMKFPPQGKRSLTAALPHFNYQRMGAKAVMEQLDRIGSTVFIMVETVECLSNIDSIAAVEGVDVLLLGANDLSLELGILGEWEHVRFQAALAAVASAAERAGKVFGISGLYTRPDICKRAVTELSAGYVLGHLDLGLLSMAMNHNMEQLRDMQTEAGFDAIWVSGFELSASYATPDASILPMSAIMDMTRSMSEIQDLPLVVDLDTGFGNAVTIAYIVPRFAAAGAAAVVIEDKQFPKDSSLRVDGRHSLVTIEEFQGKIAAAKAASPALVIARTEALVAGLGKEEALRRGIAYAEAGADAVLIHSKQKTPEEVVSFCDSWPRQVPLVIVPTSYPQLSFCEVAELEKVGLIICGNHGIRAAVAAMTSTFKQILDEGGIAGVEDGIVPVSEIFRLQGDDTMREIEKKYLR
ncbi:Phosphonopyruvate hydrolase [Paramyrothecium foliicola]|nr:Phosphonopyruvate hydrolase [Paramyrothecium foliicola]